MDMEEIKRWPNIITASKELGIHKSSIAMACRGSRDRAKRYKWAYERQDLDGEIWKNHEPMDVQVSNMGRIKSSKYHIAYGSKTNGGYLTYGKPAKQVHVMVAEVFLPNLEKKPEVNHKDKNRANNKLENLEWVTRSEQAVHSHKNSNSNRYSTARAVKQYDLGGDFIGEYRSIRNASIQTGYSQTVIGNVISGVTESFEGYIFKCVTDNRPAVNYSKSVDFIDENENIIKAYKSVREASLELGIPTYSIYNVLGGIAKKTKDGYCFKYH